MEAGVVAGGQWKPSLSLSLCLRCCPLVNERAAATPVLCVRRYKALKASRMAASSLAGPRGAGRRIRHTSCFVFLLRRIPQQRRARVWKEQCQLLLLKLCLCLRIPTGKELFWLFMYEASEGKKPLSPFLAILLLWSIVVMNTCGMWRVAWNKTPTCL